MPPRDIDPRLREVQERLLHTETELRSIRQQLQLSERLLEERDQRLAELEIGNRKLRTDLEDCAALIDQLRRRVGDFENQVSNLVQENERLRGTLEEAARARPGIGVDELLARFRRHLEDINLVPPQEGRSPVFTEDLQVEIKGGIDLREGLRIVPPDVTPESVSTVRFVMRPATRLRLAEEEESEG